MSAGRDLGELVGAQYPRVRRVAPHTGSHGELAIDTARLGGLRLDDWQRRDIVDLLATRPATEAELERAAEDAAPGAQLDRWRWATIEGGLAVPRQNGKGAVIEAIVLLALFVLELPLVIYSAHEFKTALEMFQRIVRVVERTPAFAERVTKIPRSHGEEGIELGRDGPRLKILARSKGSGRGFSAPLVIFDEAFALNAAQVAAMLPTIGAMANPLVLSFSSAGMATSSYLHDLKRRAEAGVGRVTWLDHSVVPGPGGVDSPEWRAARRDPRVWAFANPGLGRRVTLPVLEALFAAMDKAGTWDREMLGVFDPEPVDDVEELGPLAGERFASAPIADPTSELRDAAVALVVEVARDGAAAAIAVGGMREDGRRHVELLDHRPGTDWLAGRLEEHLARWPDAVVVLDPAGPSVQLRSSRDDWHELTVKEAGEAFAELIAGVRDDRVRWCAPEDLAAALLAAAEKGQPMVTADGVTRWSRTRSPVDISPLTAITFAGWAGEYLAAHGDPMRAIL